ncbi:MAG: SpoIIE family protein phosphatase [Actinoallomurus sp.]
MGDRRLAVAVGDVVDRGLAPAGVMGWLRSALSAAICAVEAPAQALDILGRYARVGGALATTVVQTVIDRHARRTDYSSAGHLPPLLVRRDRTRPGHRPAAVRPRAAPSPAAGSPGLRGGQHSRPRHRTAPSSSSPVSPFHLAKTGKSGIAPLIAVIDTMMLPLPGIY